MARFLCWVFGHMFVDWYVEDGKLVQSQRVEQVTRDGKEIDGQWCWRCERVIVDG